MAIAPSYHGTTRIDSVFQRNLEKLHLDIFPVNVETLQVNLTKLCNQACTHCHVDASPFRTEQMALATVDRCLEVLSANRGISTLDLTGGAPELNPHFDYFVVEARRLKKKVMVRHNLTVTLDGNPQTGESKAYLPHFFAEQKIEVVASLPCYGPRLTDKQRGNGVFEKSIESLRRLNQEGYGQPNVGLLIHLVHNPVGDHLPSAQDALEKTYRKELETNFGVVFNRLYTLTNMPIQRFKKQLELLGTYDAYMEKLIRAFNPQAAQGVMCRNMLSVGYDGTLYDCDFNQMLDIKLAQGAPRTIFDFDADRLRSREIVFDDHCFGCTAGAGSSCGGTTAS